MEIVDFNHIESMLQNTPFSNWGHEAIQIIRTRLENKPHGDLQRWLGAINELPDIPANEINLKTDAITASSTVTRDMQDLIKQHLLTLHPWRKGPFNLHGVYIDTEWRSNLKWNRLVPYISPLQDRNVLDIGSGNGYYLWRMLGEGATCAIGVDPTLLLAAQFQAVRHFIGQDMPAAILAIGVEDLPLAPLFDTVFSMGVIYHRRDPKEHVEQLQSLLRPGGELVLETLIIESDEESLLHPKERYAQMRNVWAIPSLSLLTHWLSDCGLQEVRIIDVTPTSLEEQRRTEWMHFQSLDDFLDKNDKSLTIEGYPAPVRATIVARQP